MQNRTLVKIKLTVIAAAVLLAVAGFYGYSAKFQKVSASASGPTASHTNAPGEANCTACHGSFPVNSGTGNMVISGIPANYKPNQQFPVTVTVNQADAVVYGFQLTAVDSQGRKVGTFTLPAQSPPQLQIVQGIVNNQPRDYVEHNSQRNYSDAVRHEIVDIYLYRAAAESRQDRSLRRRKCGKQRRRTGRRLYLHDLESVAFGNGDFKFRRRRGKRCRGLQTFDRRLV